MESFLQSVLGTVWIIAHIRMCNVHLSQGIMLFRDSYGLGRSNNR